MDKQELYVATSRSREETLLYGTTEIGPSATSSRLAHRAETRLTIRTAPRGVGGPTPTLRAR
jgi:hypothetical protein